MATLSEEAGLLEVFKGFQQALMANDLEKVEVEPTTSGLEPDEARWYGRTDD